MSKASGEANLITRRRRFGFRGVALVLAGMIALGLVTAWMAMSYAAIGQLARAEREADRLDPGWRLGNLIDRRAKVTDDANSAIVAQRALALMRGPWPPAAKVRPRGLGAPPGTPRRVKADLMERLEKIPPSTRLDIPIASELRRGLAPFAESREIARTLADAGPGLTPLKLPRLLWATLLGHVQNSRTLAILLQADAELRAHDGDIDGAIHSCRAMIGVARSIGDEFFAISQLVRMVLSMRSAATAERVLAQGEASDAELAKLQADALDEADQPLLLWGLRGERAATDDVFAKLSTGEVTPAEAFGAGGIDPNMPSEALASVSGAYVRYNQSLILKAMNEAVEIAKRPASDQSDLLTRWEKSQVRPEETLPRLVASLANETTPSVGGIGWASLRHKALLGTLAVMLACERHRLRHGSFPNSTDAIDRAILPSPPIDPFSGRPIIVKPLDGGLVIYSVGKDRTDDGGTLFNRNPEKPHTDLGHRLFAVKDRARPPADSLLPEDVFQHLPEDDETDETSP